MTPGLERFKDDHAGFIAHLNELSRATVPPPEYRNEAISPEAEHGPTATLLREEGMKIIGVDRRIVGAKFEVQRELFLGLVEGQDPEEQRSEVQGLTGMKTRIQDKPAWAAGASKSKEIVVRIPRGSERMPGNVVLVDFSATNTSRRAPQATRRTA